MSLPVLIVLHQEHSSPGRIGLELKRRGIPLDIRRPLPRPDTGRKVLIVGMEIGRAHV